MVTEGGREEGREGGKDVPRDNAFHVLWVFDQDCFWVSLYICLEGI